MVLHEEGNILHNIWHQHLNATLVLRQPLLPCRHVVIQSIWKMTISSPLNRLPSCLGLQQLPEALHVLLDHDLAFKRVPHSYKEYCLQGFPL